MALNEPVFLAYLAATAVGTYAFILFGYYVLETSLRGITAGFILAVVTEVFLYDVLLTLVAEVV